MERLSLIIQVGPECSPECPYKGDLTDRRQGKVTAGRDGSDAATSQGLLAATKN